MHGKTISTMFVKGPKNIKSKKKARTKDFNYICKGPKRSESKKGPNKELQTQVHTQTPMSLHVC